jgi:ParB-like chromosome segregation protein Spo0J
MIIKHIEIAHIYPNQWNPNRMDVKTFEALAQSAEEFGNIDPLTVRQLADNNYQIIDGYHRYLIDKQKGIKSIDCVVIDCTEIQAKRLTQILNRTRGTDDPFLLKDLLKSLEDDIDIEDILRGLPMDTDDYSKLLKQLDKETKPSFDSVEAGEHPLDSVYDESEYSESDKSFFVGIPMDGEQYDKWNDYKSSVGIKSDKSAFWNLFGDYNDR